MKTIAFIALLLLSLLSALSQTNGAVILYWDNPSTNAGIQAFSLYQATNLSLPMTNWTRVASIPYGQTQAVVNLQPGERFYYLTTSNGWGESFPSIVVSVPPLATPTPLHIQNYYRTNS